MKNIQDHQFPNGIIKYYKFNTKKLVLLSFIFLIILTIVPVYHPSINYSSFFFSTSNNNNVDNNNYSSSSSPSSSPSEKNVDIRIQSSSTHKCDIFSGEWVPNPEAPYYTNDTCWAIHEHQNCMKYGRPDSEFMKWKWKPDGCDLPVFNPAQFLELVRDKSLAFVGDSVARNQMQSLICLLSRVEYPIDESFTKDEQFKRWKYTTYNFTLATFWTPHLVKGQESDPNGPTKTGLFSLYLDELDETWTTQVEDFDYIILSGGHWFMRPMVFYENHKIVGCHFCQLPNVTDLGMYYGYRRAMRTAMKAINGLKNYKGVTYLRTFAPSHFEGGLWNQGGNCVRTAPFRSNETLLEGPNMEFYMTQVEEFRNAEREARKRGLKFRNAEREASFSWKSYGKQRNLMAPHGDKSHAAEEAAVSQAENSPISTILIVIAMQTEALPVVNKFQLTEDPHSAFPSGVPWVRYHGIYKDLHINVVWPGKDLSLGVDSVGTISASLVTYASVQALKPDLIINAGTAGGFKAKGAGIGDVFLASDVAFHDRRIPIPVFDLYGVGLRQACSTPKLLKELNLKVGKLSTGDSLDMCPHDEASITANDATIKDMEGAAVAYVADIFKVPTIFVKAVTDIVDGEKPTAEEFLQNLAAVTAALEQSVTQVIEFINGKSLGEL